MHILVALLLLDVIDAIKREFSHCFNLFFTLESSLLLFQDFLEPGLFLLLFLELTHLLLNGLVLSVLQFLSLLLVIF